MQIIWRGTFTYTSRHCWSCSWALIAWTSLRAQGCCRCCKRLFTCILIYYKSRPYRDNIRPLDDTMYDYHDPPRKLYSFAKLNKIKLEIKLTSFAPCLLCQALFNCYNRRFLETKMAITIADCILFTCNLLTDCKETFGKLFTYHC